MALANRASAQRTDARRNWRTTARLRRSAAAALGSSAAAPSTFPSEGMSCSSIHSKQRPRQLSTSRGAMDKPLQPRMPMRARQQEQPPPAHTSPWRTVSRLLVGIAAWWASQRVGRPLAHLSARFERFELTALRGPCIALCTTKSARCEKSAAAARASCSSSEMQKSMSAGSKLRGVDARGAGGHVAAKTVGCCTCLHEGLGQRAEAMQGAPE